MYKISTYITKELGNNAFSYNQRIALWSAGKLYIPSLIQGTVADLECGSEICFEEAEFTESRSSGIVDGKLVSCTGLKNFLQTTFHDTPVYIVDNHNHALAFWHIHKTLNPQQPQASTFNLIHIDQHSDIKPNENKIPIPGSWFPIPKVEDFVNEKTNVGNFIPAAITSWIINEVIQVRTDFSLDNLSTFNVSTFQPFILDIDIDFREGKDITPAEIETIRTLMKHAEIVTIATSPYFIDQEKAIGIVQKILN